MSDRVNVIIVNDVITSRFDLIDDLNIASSFFKLNMKWREKCMWWRRYPNLGPKNS